MENKNLAPNENKDEKNLMIDHDYDGIKELNNPPPPWLMWLFYITVAWGAGYVAYFHWFDQGALQSEEYETEMAEAAEIYENTSIDINSISLLKSQEDITAGAELFSKNCAVCHGKEGTGNGINPDLTDDEWIYGDQSKDVFTVIKNGKPEKGMISFSSSLSEDDILKVTSYVLTDLNKGNN